MALVMVFGVGLGLYVRSVQVQQNAVAAIKKAGGSVVYDWEWDNYNPDIINLNGKPRAPRWLADRVGVDYVGNVVYVSLVPRRANDPNKANDDTLAHVGRLGHLKHLVLNNTAITDAGLVHLKGLTNLRGLDLWHTQVGDTGLTHLKELTSLRELLLAGTRVTDDGVLEFQKALPSVQVRREEDMFVGATVQRANKDLDFARSQPIRVASSLLVHRAKFMMVNGDKTEFIATVDALCDLEAHDKLSLIKVAEARAECLGILQPDRSPKLSATERQALQQRCADRGVAALALAIEQGYDNIRRLEGDPREVHMLWNLRSHPAFPKLIETMKAKRPVR